MRRRARPRGPGIAGDPFSASHLITWAAMFLALVAGLWLNSQQSDRQAADNRERIDDIARLAHRQEEESLRNCVASLTGYRYLYTALVPAPGADAAVRAQLDALNVKYASEYWKIEDAAHLEDLCGADLPADVPGPPPRPAGPTSTSLPPPSQPPPSSSPTTPTGTTSPRGP